jgi:hypothetical protein
LVDGQPIFLDEAMRPVEPVSSWFRSLWLDRHDQRGRGQGVLNSERNRIRILRISAPVQRSQAPQ